MCCPSLFFFFSSRRRHTRCALVTGVQTCALPISLQPFHEVFRRHSHRQAEKLAARGARPLRLRPCAGTSTGGDRRLVRQVWLRRPGPEIGSASCRERARQYVSIPAAALSFNKTHHHPPPPPPTPHPPQPPP